MPAEQPQSAWVPLGSSDAPSFAADANVSNVIPVIDSGSFPAQQAQPIPQVQPQFQTQQFQQAQPQAQIPQVQVEPQAQIPQPQQSQPIPQIQPEPQQQIPQVQVQVQPQQAQPVYQIDPQSQPMTTSQFQVVPPVQAQPEQVAAAQPVQQQVAVAQPIQQPAPEEPRSNAHAGGVAPAIVFDHVTKIYDAQPDKPALKDVSLQVYPGEFVFLVGHSGSGKSTFIRLLNRELEVTSGTLWVAGENLSAMRNWRIPYLRRNIGCVFQDFKLLPKKTAFENVAFALEVIGKSKRVIKTQVPEVLRLVGLEDAMDKMPDQLSGGEQQRVSIARAIVNRPPLLICDEPTGNLDPQTSLGIMRLLDRINRTGTIVLVATHDKEMVNSLRRRVVTLENGVLVRDQDKGVYGLDA